MTSLLPADNPASVKTDSTSCSDFGQISLGTHTVQTVSNYVWVWHWYFGTEATAYSFHQSFSLAVVK